MFWTPCTKALGSHQVLGDCRLPLPFLLGKQGKLSGLFPEMRMKILFFFQNDNNPSILAQPSHSGQTIFNISELSWSRSPAAPLSLVQQPYLQPASNASCFAPIYHQFMTAVSHRHNHLALCSTPRSAGTGPPMSKGYPE